MSEYGVHNPESNIYLFINIHWFSQVIFYTQFVGLLSHTHVWAAVIVGISGAG